MRRPLREGIVFIGVGSNLDDPLEQCRRAIRCIGETEDIRVLRCSSFYRTEPHGLQEQPWFVNAVVEVRTALPPRALLDRLKGIEKTMGRLPGEKWGPRVIDLDLLLYDQRVIDEEGLTVPHPEMHKRRFVLAPLHELAPYTIHPAFGISVQGLLERLEDTGSVEMISDPAE